MTPRSTIREHIRSNIVGYIALFCFATSGTAVALSGKNTVFSNDIVNRQVKSPDLARHAVRGAKLARGAVGSAAVAPDSLGGRDIDESKLELGFLQARVAGACDPGTAIRTIGVGGDVDCQATGGGAPSGPAGGDLTGSYPNPLIAANSVGTDEVDNSLTGANVSNDSLTGADIDESSLDTVPAAAELNGLSAEVLPRIAKLSVDIGAISGSFSDEIPLFENSGPETLYIYDAWVIDTGSGSDVSWQLRDDSGNAISVLQALPGSGFQRAVPIEDLSRTVHPGDTVHVRVEKSSPGNSNANFTAFIMMFEP